MAQEKTESEFLEYASGTVNPESLEIDHEAERKLLRKLDLHIAPMVFLGYLVCFLDRVNIGNARLYDLENDLHLRGNQYQIALSVLFATYILSEIPSNLLIKRIRPSRWISFLTVSWGIIATLSGLCQNFGGLVACRLLLGLFEGGLFPGFLVYLTLFYTKDEIALRVCYFFVSSAFSGACGGLLTYCIGFMDGVAGLRGWRWIFIIEGLPTFIYGLAAWFLLADDPESASYLTSQEKELMMIRRERHVGSTASGNEFHKKDMILAFQDWKIYMFCLAQFCMVTMLYGYSVFLPTIIQGLGNWTTAQIQALTIPCYIVGAICYLGVAVLSDHQQRRGIYVLASISASIIGYGLLISKSNERVHYFAACLIASGMYSCLGIAMAWLPSNQPRYGKRTTATAMQVMTGNAAGILASFLYPTTDAPRYVMGQSITLALLGVAFGLFVVMILYFSRVNKRRMEGKEDASIAGLTEEEVNELGDRSPRFIYTV
ncbi:MFS transporter [Penicillium riverlandense]|uniref:MFS transporter n=1 Tax=Penicillium riverlandense TaxID=1903569 RepID=UPI00254696CF|nr:MFS transporter [Penicillium riverlandense]KAJ5811672.1 MFS transporter [Penicillium riverlandense]